MPDNDDLGASQVREGDIIAGKYRIERVLGCGGMGVVVAATHLQLDERVAIKLLLPAALELTDAVTRFLREAKAAVRIKSEHVVRVIDVGTLDDGAPYMVMEYLDGCDLGQWLQQHGTLEIEQSVEFILQALEAIADAHALGIVHRDLKPANLYCVRRSDGLLAIKVLDFGISKINDKRLAGGTLAVTAPSAMMGSPFYMSPEQMRSARDVDSRADIWAIGVILYEMLTGTVPFGGDTVSSVSIRAATCPPQPIADFRPGVPVELEHVVLKCLEKEPAHRYHDVAALAFALLPFAPPRAQALVERVGRIIAEAGLAGEPATVSVDSATRSGVTGKTLSSLSGWGHTKSHSQLGRIGLIGGLLLVLLIVLMAGGFTLFRGAELTRGVAGDLPVAVPIGPMDPAASLAAAVVAPPTSSSVVVAPTVVPSTTPPPAAKVTTAPRRKNSSAMNQTKDARSMGASKTDDLFAGPQ